MPAARTQRRHDALPRFLRVIAPNRGLIMSRATYEPAGATSPARLVPPLRPSPAEALSAPAERARRPWRRVFLRRLVVGDAAAALGAAAVPLAITGPPPPVAVLALPPAWLLALVVVRSYDRDVLCEGVREFGRVLLAAGLVLAGIAIYAWGWQQDVPRDLVALTLTATAALTVGVRWGQRAVLSNAQKKGRYTRTTLLVGHRRGVVLLDEQLRRAPRLGYSVIGCCLPAADPAGQLPAGLPVLGGLDDVADLVREHHVDTVAAIPSRELDGATLRHLGWELETTCADLLVAPTVTGRRGPRVRIRSVSGMSLLHVVRAQPRGARGLAKSVLDRVGAALLLVLVLPVMLAVAVAVKLSSQGPAIFRQQRVGRNGRVFPMLKFRTMDCDAERRVPELVGASDGNGVLFKMRRDPRVTRVGRFLRHYSLDELPQLLNVVKGDMSLVGPRPALPAEVATYDLDMRRRLVVKPGLTGLWQVGGRSNLSWEESVRLDLEYVENWSLLLDLAILWRTIRAVIRADGAY
jgi:exopolysaccharide biosynthesis polyprenyl glycosylphosphotransferase